MLRIKKRAAVAAVAAITALSAVSLAAKAQAKDLLATVKERGELVIGTEFQFAPFDFIENGKQAGLNLDLYTEIAKELGVKARFIDLPWPSVLPGLEAQKFDIVGGPLIITKQRMERYRFTPPIADATVALLKSAKDDSIKTPQDIAGKKVGGGKASAQLAQLQEFVKTLPGETEVREYVDNNQAYADLAAGRIAAVGNSLPNIAYVAKQRPNVFSVVMPPFGKPVYFAYVGRKDDEAKSLMDAVDAALLKIKKDGRLGEIQKKWFGTTMDVPDSVTEPNA
jgi:polar amino acid transport system substrate-binding protein